MNILEENIFGNFHFHTAKILRDALFVNSVLDNSEVWYNITKKKEQLESVDNSLLKRIFETPSTCPIPFLHLELGTVPLRFIIKQRRIMYLHYLLQQNDSSLIYRFLKTQIDDPSRGDWVLLVKQDLEDFSIDYTFEEIAKIKKDSFKTITKRATKETAFAWLTEEKENMSKINQIAYKITQQTQIPVSAAKNLPLTQEEECYS